MSEAPGTGFVRRGKLNDRAAQPRAKPANLPVQQPIKYDLTIKAAKAIGLPVPPHAGQTFANSMACRHSASPRCWNAR